MREEGRERGDWVRRGARSHGGGEGEIGVVLCKIAIDASRDRDRRGASRDRDRRSASRDRDRRSALRDRDRRRDLSPFARSRDLSPFARSRDRSFSLSFSLCVSVSSLCASQFRKPFEVKIGTEMNFRGQSFFFMVK